ncbi:HIT domain-containing protein [Natrarchaeobius halalkaliphilus]|uniref:HIT domain-containing protein n=1 Tax=Natrarchaeobius halalkaliphilus TaxID=1679091 RepID=A0A3N6LVF0_9EURY|nr:HIT domain-containing protein [Natrarchaeobius halalkaliphilus]RQG91664.1 HIT domain-containing protein [Natrarchaeobius halalkaliphilus]
MDDCTFCRIAAGTEPASVLFEDERTIAFLDTQPAVTGHSLVVPREHEVELLTAESSTTEAVFRTVRTVASALETAFKPDGFSVFHSTDNLVGTVEHAHVHLVPRYETDDVSLSRHGFDDEEAATVTGSKRLENGRRVSDTAGYTVPEEQVVSYGLL